MSLPSEDDARRWSSAAKIAGLALFTFAMGWACHLVWSIPVTP